METVIGVLLIIMGIFLIVSVLMQSSKDHRLSGSIAGGAETFFGKQKGKTLDAMFNKLTTIVTIIFVVLVLVLYVMQPSLESLMADQYTELDTETEQDAALTDGENADVADDDAEAADDDTDVADDDADVANGDAENADNAEAADDADTDADVVDDAADEADADADVE